ncbi:ATP-binding protein [Peptoniphilus asaccharolyticus]
MKIEELNLQAFGKFKNRKIELKEGLNLIQGKNESGKSTIFKFIEGIFYGFAKSGTQRRTTPDYDRYRPWTGNEYKGSAILTDDDSFRIMRNFEKHELEFYNMTTGENLSSISELNQFAKIKQPGVFLFNVDYSIFRNSFFIGQLCSKLDSEVDSLKHSLENFATSGNEKYSLVNAIEKLEEKRDALGKESRKTSIVGKLYQEIAMLDKKKNELNSHLKDYAESTAEFLEIKQSLLEQKKFVKNLKLSDDQRNYFKIKTIAENKSPERELSDEDFDLLYEMDRSYVEIERQLNQKTEEKSFEYKYGDIEEDYTEFKSLCDRIDELNRNNFSKEIELLNHDLIITKAEVDKLRLIMFTELGLAFLMVVLAVYLKVYYSALFAIPMLFHAYLKFNPYRMKKAAIDRIEDRINNYMQKSSVKTEEKREMDKVFSVYMRKYRINSFDELKSFLENEKSEIDKLKIEENVRTEIETKNRIELEDKLKELKNKIEELEIKYNLSFEGLREKYLSEDGKRQRQELKNRESIIAHILNGRDLEDLNHGIEVVEGNLTEEESMLEELESKFLSLSGELYSKDEKFHLLNEIEEEISLKKSKLDELEQNQQAMQRAIDVLREVYAQNKSVFLPKIVKFMNDFISDITSDKYNRIVVDDSFNIAVEDTVSGKMVEAEKLSNGTIDQLYLGLRLAVSEMLYKDAPIILDDHFIQYDDERCKETLKFLDRYSKIKQVIIFSAMNRECEMLDSMGAIYNRVNL